MSLHNIDLIREKHDDFLQERRSKCPECKGDYDWDTITYCVQYKEPCPLKSKCSQKQVYLVCKKCGHEVETNEQSTLG